MNNISSSKHNNRGATSIILTMIIVTSMLLVALTVSSIVQNGLVMSRAHLNSTKAYFAAESGVERTLYQIRKSGPQAFNPTLDANWVPGANGCCIQINSQPFTRCQINCDTTLQADIVKIYDNPLQNGSKYKIKYETVGVAPDVTAVFSATGIYENITKRVVEIRYKF